jgi:hypothetical protein
LRLHNAAAVHPSEPISPELVLVCPELREHALANEREFPAPQPYRPRPARARPPNRPERTPPRRRAGRRLVFAAAAVFVIAALAVAPGFTGGERPTLEPSPPQRVAGTHRQASVPVTRHRHPGRNRSKPHTTTAGTGHPAPPVKSGSRDHSKVPRATALELAVEAERNVLQSPRFFFDQGGAAAALIDPATKLFRANTRVTCSVTQRRRNGSWDRLCSVHRGPVSIRVRYVPTGRSSFRLATP